MDKGFVEFAAKITILHRDPNFFKNENQCKIFKGKLSKSFSENVKIFGQKNEFLLFAK